MADIKLVDELHWGFDGGGAKLKIKGNYWEEVDPFPCYHHDLSIVDETIKKAQAGFLIEPRRGPRYSVLAYDTKSHVNGWCNVGYDYTVEKEDGSYPWHIEIAMMGKRTPIHPAMTRFVTAHEYGHGVEDVLERKLKENPNGYMLRPDYAEIRGMENSDEFYGGRTWHRSIGEIFADDFRLLMAKVELEHWPHPGIERPENLPKVKAWWKKMKKLYAYTGESTE